MLEKGIYDSWKMRIWLYIQGKKNGEMLIDSIENGPFKLKAEITIPGFDGAADQKRAQTVADLSPTEKLQYDCDIKATNIILLGLPIEIYTLINHFQTAKEIWDRVKELMEGESFHSYYWRYAKLINDINIIKMKMTPIQVNTKFVNHLQPKWSRFVTAAKQAKDLHKCNFDQLYAFLNQNENDAKEVRAMRQRYPNPLALLANQFNPPPSYSSSRSHYNLPAEYHPF
ncbi:hypothetical protein Tco_0084237 [Tanacetum coccineum]